MFDHVTIRVSDGEAAERFYDLVLSAIGLDPRQSGEHYTEWGDFSIAPASAGVPVTRRLHIAFYAPSPDLVDKFWRTAVAAGHPEDGAPGPRPEYSEHYYGAFLRDPDGNSVEAVTGGDAKQGGTIDHVWVRVADLGAARRFYETIAPYAGLRLGAVSSERVQFRSATGTFSLVAGEPTEHLHLAFPAADNATVDAFHRVATAAGYRDRGAPGERPQYHEGYYGAFVLDPDGTNVEVVNHNR